MQPQTYPLTAAGKKKLKEELTYLKDVKQKELSEQIKEHRGYCDFSDNISFSQTLDQQANVRDRIADIEELLLNVALIQSEDEQTTVVRFGSTVTILELPNEIEQIYTIVGTVEADPLVNKISIDSPIGSNLIGSKIGEVVLINIPSGEIKVKVLAIK